MVKESELESFGFKSMTKKSIKDLCKKNKLYITPRLNNVLYLHFQGYQKIENLEEYTHLTALWLESNAISKIAGLEAQTKLKCLYLHNNLITNIENLDACVELDTINLSHNQLINISNCGTDVLPVLSNLNVSHNYFQSMKSIVELKKCKNLTVLDISHNRLDDILVIKVFSAMPELRVLVLSGNPVVNDIPHYRNTMINECKKLTYLDSRPVFPRDRSFAEAWKRGGVAAQQKEQRKWAREDRRQIFRNVNDTIRLRNRGTGEPEAKLISTDDEDTDSENHEICPSIEACIPKTQTWDEIYAVTTNDNISNYAEPTTVNTGISIERNELFNVNEENRKEKDFENINGSVQTVIVEEFFNSNELEGKQQDIVGTSTASNDLVHEGIANNLKSKEIFEEIISLNDQTGETCFDEIIKKRKFLDFTESPNLEQNCNSSLNPVKKPLIEVVDGSDSDDVDIESIIVTGKKLEAISSELENEIKRKNLEEENLKQFKKCFELHRSFLESRVDLKNSEGKSSKNINIKNNETDNLLSNEVDSNNTVPRILTEEFNDSNMNSETNKFKECVSNSVENSLEITTINNNYNTDHEEHLSLLPVSQQSANIENQENVIAGKIQSELIPTQRSLLRFKDFKKRLESLMRLDNDLQQNYADIIDDLNFKLTSILKDCARIAEKIHDANAKLDLNDKTDLSNGVDSVEMDETLLRIDEELFNANLILENILDQDSDMMITEIQELN